MAREDARPTGFMVPTPGGAIWLEELEPPPEVDELEELF